MILSFDLLPFLGASVKGHFMPPLSVDRLIVTGILGNQPILNGRNTAALETFTPKMLQHVWQEYRLEVYSIRLVAEISLKICKIVPGS